MSARYHRTCHNCLGNGCIHCNSKGQITMRVFTRKDVEAERLRRAMFGVKTQPKKPGALG